MIVLLPSPEHSHTQQSCIGVHLMLHLHKYVSCSGHEVLSTVHNVENTPNQGLGMSLSFEPGMGSETWA